MDAAAVFRQQGLGTVFPIHHTAAPVPFRKHPIPRKQVEHPPDNLNRIAHTLTACCRCRQRKTRCDPSLPKCLPCERSGSVCEYFDTAKGKKISRYYVIKLQDKVRALEAELGMYTDEDDVPRNTEDIVRPGGMVSVDESDETPRYLGPSSGIAMTRILMEEAKRYTDSKRISDLIPQVRVRTQGTRNQSIAFGPSARKKSFPLISAHPAQTLPTRQVADRLVDVFCERAQVFTPTLHEKVFAQDLEKVYAGEGDDAFMHFIVRMVLAIALQKLDLQYAGLADSYYLAAMGYFQEVVRQPGWKTLQCLVLIGQYSLLTPTRTAAYYIIGLATRICQQLGLDSESTITSDNPMDLDMKRRLTWAVASMEFGLAQTMGRPNGFTKGNGVMDVEFFSTVDDAHISEQGIEAGPPCEKKLVSIHFCKMRVLQAEIRRILYEKKRPAPRDESHPWFADIERKMEEWTNTSPENPSWCKPWFTGRYHSMLVFLYRPSPQIPQPSSRAAKRCFESAAHVINLSNQQMIKAAVDITWVFLLTLFASINALLWSVSYRDVRRAHPKAEVEDLVNTAMEIMDQCTERWPGTASAARLYPVFAKACLHSYDLRQEAADSGPGLSSTPLTVAEARSPLPDNIKCEPLSPSQQQHQQQQHQQQQQQQQHPQQQPRPMFNPPQFGAVFDTPPDPIPFQFDDPFQPGPTFRSNSIFLNPTSQEPTNGRRFSYFPPDAMSDDPTVPSTTYAASTTQSQAVSPAMTSNFSSPPDSTTHSTPTPTMHHASPAHMHSAVTPTMSAASVNTTPTQPPPRTTPQQPPMSVQTQRTPFTIPPPPQHHVPQRPLPPATTVTDWFSPPEPLIGPYTVSNFSSGYLGAPFGHSGNGGGVVGPGGSGGAQQQHYTFPGERHGSLSAEQQMELMDVLETEGLGDIDTLLNSGMGLAGGGIDGGLVMQGWGAGVYGGR